MTIGLETPVGFVDPSCPIEWSHPLNRGLVFDTTILPNSGWRGGAVLRDITRGGKSFTDGTLTSGPVWSGPSGRSGGYVALSYNSSYSSFGSPLKAQLAVWTVSAWIKAAAIGGGNYRSIVNYGQNLGGDYRNFNLATNNAAQARIYFTDPVNTYHGVEGATTLSAGVWYHLSGTYNGTTLVLYVNGKSDGSLSYSGTPTYTTGALYVGCLEYQVTPGQINEPFNGLIDGAQLLNRALSASQIAQLYQEQRRGRPETLRWYGARTWFVGSSGSTAYTRTATDAPTTTDAATRLFTGARSLTDAPTTTDAVTRIATHPRAAADAPTTNDAATRVFVGARSITDAPTTSDVATRLQVLARSVTDTPTTTDAATRVQTLARSLTDAPATTDTATRLQVLARSLTAAPTTTDAVTRVQVCARSLSDAPTTSDLATRLGTFHRSLTDAPTTSDVVQVSGQVRTVTDSPTTTDAATRLQVLGRSETDVPTTTDTVARVQTLARSVNDAPTTTDAATRFVVFTRTVTDTPTTTDTATRLYNANRNAADSPTTVDAATRLFIGIRTATDSPTTADVATIPTFLVAYIFIYGTGSVAQRAYASDSVGQLSFGYHMVGQELFGG